MENDNAVSGGSTVNNNGDSLDGSLSDSSSLGGSGSSDGAASQQSNDVSSPAAGSSDNQVAITPQPTPSPATFDTTRLKDFDLDDTHSRETANEAFSTEGRHDRIDHASDPNNIVGGETKFVDGGSGNDSITGGIGNDHFRGGDGADTLVGGEGRDRFEFRDNDESTASRGRDHLGDFRSGEDIIDFGAHEHAVRSFDDLDFEFSGGKTIVTMRDTEFSFTMNGEVTRDSLQQGDVQFRDDTRVHDGDEGEDRFIGNQELGNRFTGGDGSDFARGGDASDILKGGRDNDDMRGGGGDDDMRGGKGDDDVRGGDGNDLVEGDLGDDHVEGGRGDDEVNGGQGADTIHGGKDTDWVSGQSGDDVIFGELGDDRLRGGKDNDHLDGGAGADWLLGDKGNDTITGGAGADEFYYFRESGGWGNDTILDFSQVEGDTLHFGSGFDDSGNDNPLFGGVAQNVVDATTIVGGNTVITADDGSGATITLVGVTDLTTAGVSFTIPDV